MPNFLAVHIINYNIYSLALYRPQSNSCTDNQLLLQFQYGFCPDKEIILLADFNLPSITQPLPNPGITSLDSLFLNCFCSFGFRQLVLEPTFYQSGNILDLILVFETERIGEINVLPPFPYCGHCPIILSSLS